MKLPRCTKTVSGKHTFTKKFLMGASIALKQEIYGPETCIFCEMINDTGDYLSDKEASKGECKLTEKQFDEICLQGFKWAKEDEDARKPHPPQQEESPKEDETPQADWVKELEVDLEERLSHITFNMEKYKLNNYGHELPARPALDFMMKDLVKKYVDLAQQRTEKKWREKAKKLMKPTTEGKGDYTDFTTSTGTRDTLLQWSYNQALTDLLEEQ